jgi:putative ABC transport system substrate-binding protein
MRRRDFIAGAAGLAAAWPLAARAQQVDRMRRVGVLIGSDDNTEARALFAEFQKALEQLGLTYGRNIQIDIRWGSDAERIIAYTKELVRLSPDVIFAGPTNVVRPLQQETRTIPIVFVRIADPLGQGIVESLARPTGNVTGFSNPDFPLIGKLLQILKDIAPSTTRVGMMTSGMNVASAHYYGSFETLAPSLAMTPIDTPIREVVEIEHVFQSLAREPNSGLVIPGDVVLEAPSNRALIIRLAASYRLPVVYGRRPFVVDGGLVFYGVELADIFRRAASYVDRILKGEKPSDLPVQQPTKYELVINLKTATTLGLTIPTTLLTTADAVIE